MYDLIHYPYNFEIKWYFSIRVTFWRMVIFKVQNLPRRTNYSVCHWKLEKKHVFSTRSHCSRGDVCIARSVLRRCFTFTRIATENRSLFTTIIRIPRVLCRDCLHYSGLMSIVLETPLFTVDWKSCITMQLSISGYIKEAKYPIYFISNLCPFE